MSIFKRLCETAERRVNKYGAQYYTFAIFGVINYPLTLLYELRIGNTNEGVLFRLVATLLCLILLLKNNWPEKTKKYLPLFWYVTITLSLPVIASYMLLKENFSLGWLINFNIGAMIAVLVLDSLSFLIIEIIGVLIGCSIYFILGNQLPKLPDYYHSKLFFYMLGSTILLVVIFSRNREIFNDIIQKSKDDLNQKLEEKVIERTRELNLALSAKNEFLNNISHEIRTPLQGFLSISEGLVDHWKDFSEEEKFGIATKIAKNSQRLCNVIGKILDLSKFGAKKMLLDFTVFDLDKVAKNIMDECYDLYINENKFNIVYQSLTETSLVFADYIRVEQVLRNIIYNAIKYSDNKGLIYFTIGNYSNCTYKEYYHIKIEDRGVGIPNEELEIIFDPFIQSSRTKNRAGGTGLGLSISKEIIYAHKGEIWAENNIGVPGATFNIILPKYKIQENIFTTYDGNEHFSNEISYIKFSDQISKSLLMIDDEQICLDSMEMILMESSYLFIKAKDGKSGLEYLKKCIVKPDLILLDIMLPDINGLDILDFIKKDPKLSIIPVILQTGIENREIIDLAFQKGIVEYFKKPYKKEEIIKKIEIILAHGPVSFL